MTSLRAKFLCSASIAVVLLTLSNCSGKPNHPQKSESFVDRRNPQENSKASSGALGSAATKNKVVVNYNDPVKLGKVSVEKEVESPEDRSFLERMFGATAREDEKADQQSSIEGFKVASLSGRRLPAEQSNPILAYSNDKQIAQGSSDSQSYFDKAEPIKSALIYPVVEVPLNSASIISSANAAENDKMPALPEATGLNSSVPAPVTVTPPMQGDQKAAPMVNVPSIPSNEQMKKQVSAQQKPQLADVPNSVPPASLIPTQAPEVVRTPMSVQTPSTPSAPFAAPSIPSQMPAYVPAASLMPNHAPVTPHHAPTAPSVVTPMPSNMQAAPVVPNPLVDPLQHAPAQPTMPTHVEHNNVGINQQPVIAIKKVVKKKPVAKKTVRKVVKKKAAAANYDDIVILDNSLLVEENGRVVTKKFLNPRN